MAQRSMSRTMCPGVKSWWDRFRKVARELTGWGGVRRLVVGALPMKSAIERSVLKQRGGINEAGLWVCRQRAASHPDQVLMNVSTPDETAVSDESACRRKRLTISSAAAGEKHMAISTIFVILWKFRRGTISPTAILLPVASLKPGLAALRFCGSCRSGKPRRPDC